MSASTKVLGQRIDCITPVQLMRGVKKSIEKKRKMLCFAMNVHILVELSKAPAFAKKHNQADVIFADGVPLVWLSHLTNQPLPARVSGTDLVEQLLKSNEQIFLLGSTKAVLQKLTKKYPHTIAGYYAPPFSKKWRKSEQMKIISQIQKSKAKVLLVGVGPLKQEKWLLEYFDQTKAMVGIGVGSAFDILAGKTPRAPQVVQGMGMEWLWRAFQEPGRLAPRYSRDVTSFIWLGVKHLAHRF